MKAALHTLQQGNIRIGFLQEKKVPGGDPHTVWFGLQGMGGQGGEQNRGGIIIIWRQKAARQI